MNTKTCLLTGTLSIESILAGPIEVKSENIIKGRTVVHIGFLAFGTNILGTSFTQQLKETTWEDGRVRKTNTKKDIREVIDCAGNVVEKDSAAMKHVSDLAPKMWNVTSSLGWEIPLLKAVKLTTGIERTKSPSDYQGEALCFRCSDGYENCLDGHDHNEVCREYVWAETMCMACVKLTYVVNVNSSMLQRIVEHILTNEAEDENLIVSSWEFATEGKKISLNVEFLTDGAGVKRADTLMKEIEGILKNRCEKGFTTSVSYNVEQ